MLPPIANQFIGGESIDSAVEKSRMLESDDIEPILNYLGEHYDDRGPVMDTVDEYEELLSRIEGMNASISLKPTQLGLNISKKEFRENAKHLLSIADNNDTFVWFDMEHHHTINDTLEVVKEMMKLYSGSVGVCLQANIKETSNHMDELIETEGETHIRLVKGAYTPPQNVAYSDSNRVDENYKELINKGLENISGRLAVGSHDEKVIRHTIDNMSNAEGDLEVQFQMLRGVRENRQRELAKNYSMAQYIPYGPQWISYTYRRIREKPKNILLLGRAVLGPLLD